ncbi:unnamed protein product [Phytophthora lilii]|uniref:Unnamed protein product n=1 Tax=Phytophthora lilii TaxID=2077276 RepID=A0A9W6YKF8_9STRA|nr:unnamed protein product [Phytophthora lilii]
MGSRSAPSATPTSPPRTTASGSAPSQEGGAVADERRLLGSLRPDPEGQCGVESDASVREPVSDGSSGESSAEKVKDGMSDEESLDEFAEDRSIILFCKDLHDKVVGLTQQGKCDERCLQGKAAELENVLRSV